MYYLLTYLTIPYFPLYSQPVALVIAMYYITPSCTVIKLNLLSCSNTTCPVNFFLPIVTHCVLSAPFHPGLLRAVLFRHILSLPIEYHNVSIHSFSFHTDQTHRLPSHSMVQHHVTIHYPHFHPGKIHHLPSCSTLYHHVKIHSIPLHQNLIRRLPPRSI